jgi:hypothetical protein
LSHSAGSAFHSRPWHFWPSPKTKMTRVARPASAARCSQHAVARLLTARWWTSGGEVLGGAPGERGAGARQYLIRGEGAGKWGDGEVVE